VVGVEDGDNRGLPAVIARLDCPADWFGGAIDGRLALRLLHAGIGALESVGRDRGLGPPPLRKPSRTSRPPGSEIFGRPPREQADTGWSDALLDNAAPRSGVISAPVHDDPAIGRRRGAVFDRLRVDEAAGRRYPVGSGREVAVWPVPVL
jgi:hypothetical protein